MILRQQKIVDTLTSISSLFINELSSKDRISKQFILNKIIEGSYKSKSLNINWNDIFENNEQSSESSKSLSGTRLSSSRSSLRLTSEPIPTYLPLNTHFKINGIKKESGKIFKSALQPISITFLNEETKEELSIIFKKGDDLRQDMLISQMIKFMNDCLSANNLDLCLSPYHVLATGIDTGFVELIQNSLTVSAILKQFGSIQEYFKKSNPNGICTPDVVKTYIKSCAGYCIITYLLGIGDRHLE